MAFHDPSTPDGRFVSLGQSVPRQDGVSMLTGGARFVDDWAKDGIWVGGTLRSKEAHACLLGVRCRDSFDWARVVMVTAADIPGRNVLELVEDDQPVLAEAILRHPEEPIALVAAPDKETLQRALEAIAPETEPLEPVFDVDAALAGRVRIFGDDNVFKRIEITEGDAAGALEAAAVVIEAEYTTGSQEHVYLETQGMQAEWDGHGVTIRGSMQCPYYLVRGVSAVLGLTPERVRVVQAATGGAFGGKEDYPTLIAVHAALLARKAGRPVRIVYERIEDMRATTKRHPSRIRHRTGFTRDGRLLALEIDRVQTVWLQPKLDRFPFFFKKSGFFLDFAQPNVPRKHALFDLMKEILMIGIPIRKWDDLTASVRPLCGSLKNEIGYARNILRAISS